jgi:hypothetical protein
MSKEMKGRIMKLKAGTHLRSAVSSAEVVVIRAPDGDVELTSGGLPVVGRDDDVAESPIASGSEGSVLLGKRYVNEAQTIEVLCTKAGEGALALGGEALSMKSAKPLPSSD